MKTIWKFTLSVQDKQEIEMPKDAIILTAQIQKDELQLWAAVDTDISIPTEIRYIGICGTGNPIPNPNNMNKYISTFQLYNGALIFHVFELIK